MIDEKRVPQACREVVLILGVLPKEYLRKVPREVLWSIMEKQDMDYHPSWESFLSMHSDADNLNLLRESLALMAALNLEYWEESEEEKARLRSVYERNDKLRSLKEAGKLLSFSNKKRD